MKHLLLIVVFAGLCTAVGLKAIDLDSSGRLAAKLPLPMWVKNTTLSPLALYPEKSPKLISTASLTAGGVASFRYEGSSRKWKYVFKNGQVFSVRHRGAVKGFLFIEHFISIQSLITAVSAISGCLGVVYLIALVSGRRKRKIIQKQVDMWQERALNSEQKLNEVNRDVVSKKYEITQLNQTVHEIQKKKEKLATVATSQKEMLMTKDQELKVLGAQQREAFNKHKIMLSRVEEQKHAEIKKYEDQLNKSDVLQQEFKQKSKVKVADLEASLAAVTDELNHLLVDVRTFDVDYNDVRFNSILKGRKFEICVAKALADGEGCEILEWTPDKGFLSNLNVKQNGNPDLVLKSRDGAVFAVECKYRSGYANAKDFKNYPGGWISWASQRQATRYSEFAKNRNIPVYVALGVFKDAENPDKKLVVPLASLINKSSNKDVYFYGGKSSELLCVQHKYFHDTCANTEGWRGLISELNKEENVVVSETIS